MDNAIKILKRSETMLSIYSEKNLFAFYLVNIRAVLVHAFGVLRGSWNGELVALLFLKEWLMLISDQLNHSPLLETENIHNIFSRYKCLFLTLKIFSFLSAERRSKRESSKEFLLVSTCAMHRYKWLWKQTEWSIVIRLLLRW